MSGKLAVDLTGCVAIVTGGTRGLGRIIAATMAAAGCKVAVCGRNEPEDLPDGVSFYAADIRDPEQAKAFTDAVVEQHGRLDFLINNAGGSPQAKAATASPRFFDSILKLNLHAPMYMAQAAFPHMQAAGGGSIVNVASVSGIRPSPDTAAYGAAKAGLLNLTQSLAQEWGEDKIRVNALILGLMATETTDATYGDDEAQAKIGQSIPLGRLGRGGDVAGGVLWLCSDKAEWVSGSRINVDGGGERPYFLEVLKGA